MIPQIELMEKAVHITGMILKMVRDDPSNPGDKVAQALLTQAAINLYIHLRQTNDPK